MPSAIGRYEIISRLGQGGMGRTDCKVERGGVKAEFGAKRQ